MVEQHGESLVTHPTSELIAADDEVAKYGCWVYEASVECCDCVRDCCCCCLIRHNKYSLSFDSIVLTCEASNLFIFCIEFDVGLLALSLGCKFVEFLGLQKNDRLKEFDNCLAVDF